MERSYEAQLRLEPGHLPCVFKVPDSLRTTKPEAYIPQIVGLGPYHHFRPDLQLMLTKKRAAVKDYLELIDFNHFIGLLDSSPMEFEPVIRSCYDQHLDLEKETLSWILMVDSMVLLHFIHTWLGPEADRNKIYSNVEKLVPDVFMLENQIPTILIIQMCKVLELSFEVPTENELFEKFSHFCSEHSPLELSGVAEHKKEAFDKNNHILHFMYQMIMKNRRSGDDSGHSQSQLNDEKCIQGLPHSQSKQVEDDDGKSETGDKGTMRKRIEAFARVAANQGREIIGHAIEEFNSALTTMKNAGLMVPGNAQEVSQMLQYLEKNFLHGQNGEAASSDKIEMPSVSKLIAILNVKFKPLPQSCGIRDIDLNSNNEFYLPVIHMRASSEVILRNLVAYEATLSKQQGSSNIRNYVDLLCGIIKSERDAHLLTRAGIIKGELSDQDIVKICNGITKSGEMPDEDSKVHSTIKDANDQFNNARIVKFCRWIMKYTAIIVRVLRPAFPFLVLIFLGFQSACLIFNCRLRPQGGVPTRSLFLGQFMELTPPQPNLVLPRKVLSY